MLSFICFLFAFFLFHSPIASAKEALPRAMFVTMMDEPPVLSSLTQINKMLDFAEQKQIKTLFVQVYRANQSWFPSKVADSDPYKETVKRLGEDPFSYLIKHAHERGIQVHAWLNLLSLGNNTNAPLLRKYGATILTRNLEPKKSITDYKIDNQYFLEPGDTRVQNDLMRLVQEVVGRYKTLDGIQFDYIRYPDVNPDYGYSDINMERFKKATHLKHVHDNNVAWKEWKRDQVTGLVKMLAKKARSIRHAIKVSTTGCVSFTRAYEEAYQDWPSWVNNHIVNFVTVMNYPDTDEDFSAHIKEAKEKVNDPRKLNFAIGAYKFLDTPSKFRKQWDLCQASGAKSCVIFHYGSLQKNPELMHSLKFKD